MSWKVSESRSFLWPCVVCTGRTSRVQLSTDGHGGHFHSQPRWLMLLLHFWSLTWFYRIARADQCPRCLVTLGSLPVGPSHCLPSPTLPGGSSPSSGLQAHLASLQMPLSQRSCIDGDGWKRGPEAVLVSELDLLATLTKLSLGSCLPGGCRAAPGRELMSAERPGVTSLEQRAPGVISQEDLAHALAGSLFQESGN